MSHPSPLVTIVTPVYNQPLSYLEEAAASVSAQTDGRCGWLISDDHSRPEVWDWIKGRAADPRVNAVHQERNVGLFRNLNSALRRVETPFILLLCADDRLRPDAVERLLAATERFPEADLVLSSFDSIDESGRAIVSGQHVQRSTMKNPWRLLSRGAAVEALLRCGSFNGNLTGMFFRRSLFDRTRGFREDWAHAADWEWMYQGAKAGRILLAKESVAEVRFHGGQLSNTNLRSGSAARECAAMTRMLLEDPILRGHPSARRWATHGMQMLAWNALRAGLTGDVRVAASILGEVRRTTGVLSTFGAMLAWLPARIEMKVRGTPKLMEWQMLDPAESLGYDESAARR